MVLSGAPFVLSAALKRTGVVDWLAENFSRLAGRSLLRAMLLLALIVVPMSALVNNTPVLFLIAGMLGLGGALDATGAVAYITNHLVAVFGGMGLHVLLGAVYLLATILTEVVTNNAVAIILTPIAISLAESMGLAPRHSSWQ